VIRKASEADMTTPQRSGSSEDLSDQGKQSDYLNSKNKLSAEELVGYGRPPKAYRFAPGKSGNPGGRRKNTRRVGAILQDVIRQKVTITENGTTRRVPAIEGMIRRLTNDALRGDASAMKLLLSLVDRYSDSQETTLKLADMLAEDWDILAQYLPRLDGREQEASPAGQLNVGPEPKATEAENDV
jgi:Family of unknown function (DUF5681)